MARPSLHLLKFQIVGNLMPRLNYTFLFLAKIHHYLSRCDLFYKMGMDKTEYLELEITTMSNDVPMMSLQIHCDL